MDTIVRHEGQPITARLGDFAEVNRAEGQRLIRDYQLEDRVAFHESDAFDPDKMRAALEGFAPNLVVVSGLYELFPDNALLQRSLATIAELASPNTPSFCTPTSPGTPSTR